MQRLRYVIDRLVIYAGVSLILGAMLFSAASMLVTSLVLMGLLLVQLGVWRGASTMLPSGRTNQGLRAQVDQFIELVREIYCVANAKNAAGFATTADRLRARTEGVIDSAKVDLS